MLHTTLIARGGCWGGKAASQGGRVGADGAGVDTRRGIWWPEKDYLTKGEEDHQVFDTEFGRVGLLICESMCCGE